MPYPESVETNVSKKKYSANAHIPPAAYVSRHVPFSLLLHNSGRDTIVPEGLHSSIPFLLHFFFFNFFGLCLSQYSFVK